GRPETFLMQVMTFFYVYEFALCHNSKCLLTTHLITTLMQREYWVLRYFPHVHQFHLSKGVFSIPDERAGDAANLLI
ncbi:hypothetical protein, partial [Escherichia coli]|uniref:hypothetical protein n=2 Tax=Enterobacterales TaxID=91347 RepID=UPI001BDB6E3E